jgi:hypothetical protein
MTVRPLTTHRVAEITGFHHKAIIRAIWNGTLQVARFGHAWLIWPSDLEDYVKNHPRPSRVAHVSLSDLR